MRHTDEGANCETRALMRSENWQLKELVEL